MTGRQIEGVRRKIEKYKKALAADRRFWGGEHHDGQGIRYMIPEQYIRIGDYKGGLRYLNWFGRSFPDDCCYAVFFFKWAFILFKCGKEKEAAQKGEQAFFESAYLFDKFLGHETGLLGNVDDADPETASIAAHFRYDRNDPEFTAFAGWLEITLGEKELFRKSK